MCNGSALAQGEPRIHDASGRRQLPVGIESFEDVLTDFVYVDKSLSLCELMDRRGVTLYCRPRRFGKSTFLRMVQCFFERPVEGYASDRRALFDSLAIADAGEYYMRECGAHPVIYLNLASCGSESYKVFLARMANAVSRAMMNHRYLYDSNQMFPEEKDRFRRLAMAGGSYEELVSSLSWLSASLARYHGAKTVILIDEYDTPINDAHLHGFRHKVLEFYRRWLSDALKGTTDLYCAALTGVLRVSQESIFSELNNVQIDTTLDDDHSEAIGFTEAEALALAEYVGRADKADEMREWYDGYRFGSSMVYNPWSVLNYLRKGEAQPYWTNTSRNGIVGDLVARAGEGQTLELAALSSGGTVRKPLDLRTVFDDLASNPEAVWAQLYQAGYVTTDDTGYPNDSRRVRNLRVPNLEVRELFDEELFGRSKRLAGSEQRLRALHRAVTEADASAMQRVLRQILLDATSYYDLVAERDYHVLLLALLYAVDGYRPASSDRESGDGRCDVLLEPLSENAGSLPAHAIELKCVDKEVDEEALMDCARDVALAQAQRLSYGHGLTGAGLVRWGIAFCGKHVAVVCDRECASQEK